MPISGPRLQIASVQFAYAGNPSVVPLRDPETLVFLGATPEWTAGGSRQPAAFIAGSRPSVRVVFSRSPGKGPRRIECLIGAEGVKGPGLGARSVVLRFDAAGNSQPVDFRFSAKIERGISTARRHWKWYAVSDGRRRPLGITRHLIYHTWKQPVSPASWAVKSERQQGPFGNPAAPWVFLPVMKWTCDWAAGRDNEKLICDAILANVANSGLRYAAPAWTVSVMLQQGGGYCGGWFRMFQAMAGAQGVTIHRRIFFVDWRVEQAGVMRWCAMAVSAPGVNRKVPAEHASTFHDANFRGPRGGGAIQRFHVRRYRFWGHPDGKADGHCVNLLNYGKRWYLYDACFFTRPVTLRNFALPPSSATRPVPVERQGTFQRAYLSRAVHHMLGSLRHGDTMYRTTRPDPTQPQFNGKETRNGLTVKTAIIPPRGRNITFFWMR